MIYLLKRKLFKNTTNSKKKFYKIIGGKMSKTAVLIYDSFCNFEISVALEI